MKKSLFLTVTLCLTLSGCSVITNFFPSASKNTAQTTQAVQPESPQAESPSNDSPSTIEENPGGETIPDGKYRVTSYRCNGAQPTGTAFTDLGEATQTFQGSTLTAVYSQGNCHISIDYRLTTIHDDMVAEAGSLATEPIGNITCSDASQCSAFIKQAFNVSCGVSNQLGGMRYKVEKKGANPLRFTLTAIHNSNYCAYTKSGQDPFSVEITATK